MKSQTCPVCGSSRSTRSPSGEHLICLSCQHIIVRPREKRHAKRGPAAKRARAAAMSAAEATS